MVLKQKRADASNLTSFRSMSYLIKILVTLICILKEKFYMWTI